MYQSNLTHIAKLQMEIASLQRRVDDLLDHDAPDYVIRPVQICLEKKRTEYRKKRGY